MDKVELQRLINAVFELVFTAADYAQKRGPEWTREEQAEWLRYHLASVGVHTKPVGSSWGVLCEPERKK